jgi:hypothetical protein
MVNPVRTLPVAMAAAMALTISALAWSLWAQTPPLKGFVRPQPLGQKPDDGAKRLREGTRLIDVEGRFDTNGERWSFFRADGDESYKVLENLALERIHKVLEETRASDKPQWIVSGVMTEFGGANYLLVAKAVIKPQENAAAVRNDP